MADLKKDPGVTQSSFDSLTPSQRARVAAALRKRERERKRRIADKSGIMGSIRSRHLDAEDILDGMR